jgi:hypothetical protein
MQADGDLTLIKDGTTMLWHTNTAGSGADHAVMQTDGNAVILTPTNVKKWESGTTGLTGAYFVVQDDGNLVLYRADGKVATGTATHQLN